MSYAVHSRDGLGFIPLIIGAVAGAIGGKAVSQSDLAKRWSARDVMTRFPETKACRKCVPGKCYVEYKRCEGGIADVAKCDSGICPPQTWNNLNFKTVIGEGPWRWWVERKIRRALVPWVRPGFGYRHVFNAYAESNKVPKKFLPFTGEQLARALQNFDTLFPDEQFPNNSFASAPGVAKRWRFETGIIWKDAYLFSGDQGFRFSFPNKYGGEGGSDENPDTKDIAFHLFVPNGDAYLKEKSLQARMNGMFDSMRLKTPEQKKKFAEEAAAFIVKVPNAEDGQIVSSDVKLIAFEPGKVFVNGWLLDFVRLFTTGSLVSPLAKKPASVAKVGAAVKAATTSASKK